MKLTPEVLSQVDELVSRYPRKDAALIPLLHFVQQQNAATGWFIPPDEEAWVAQRLELPITKVREVISFYTMFNKRPVGKYHLQVCSTLSCALAGSDELVEHLATRHGIKAGETDAEGVFTMSRVECLGSCGTAPCVQINYEEFEENLSLEAVDRLIERLRTKARAN